MKVFLKVLPLLLLALALSGCGKEPVEVTHPTLEAVVLPTAPPKETQAPDPEKEATHVAAVLQAGELYTLDSYPNLKSVDLTGSTCYDAIWDFASKRPHLDVEFSVDLGGTAVSVKAPSATLAPGGFTYEALLENLQYLPNLATLSLPGESLTSDQVTALLAAYPDKNLAVTVTILGQTVTPDMTHLDLSSLDASGMDEACRKLGLLTSVTDVTLSSSLTFDQVDQLQAAAPNIVFHYEFTLFGKTISTADEEVEYKNQSIGNGGEPEIRAALKILDNCSRFILDNCQLDNEVLAGIRADFRDGPKVVWRVYFGVDGRYNSLTDADTLRAVYNVTDSTCGPMKYCEDVKYMDIGHNEYLTDLTFVSHMPNIEVLIASGCAVKELVGFDNCKKLTWLELASCGKLTNIDSLSGCESLRFLNLSFTKVSNYQPLDTLPLERFVCLSPKASAKEQKTFQNIHPKGQCITVFYGYSNPYGYGWRYDDNGKTFNEYYKNVVRVAFNYDLLESWLPKDDK